MFLCCRIEFQKLTCNIKCVNYSAAVLIGCMAGVAHVLARAAASSKPPLLSDTMYVAVSVCGQTVWQCVSAARLEPIDNVCAMLQRLQRCEPCHLPACLSVCLSVRLSHDYELLTRERKGIDKANLVWTWVTSVPIFRFLKVEDEGYWTSKISRKLRISCVCLLRLVDRAPAAWPTTH